MSSVEARRVAEAPDDPEPRLALGAALAHAGVAGKALLQFAAALALAPENARVHYNLGLFHARTDRTEAAEASYRRALALDRGHRASANNLGQILMSRRALREAGRIYHAVLADDPTQASAHNNLGIVHLGLKNIGAAQGHFAAALALAPGYGHALHNMGLVLQRLGKEQAAVRWHSLAALTDEPPAGAIFALGVAAQKAGQADLAIIHYRRTLALEPSLIDAQANLANALIEDGQVEAAFAAAESVLARRPDHPHMLWTQSWGRLLRGDLEGGFAHYDVRWRRPDADNRQHQFKVPLWDGRPLQSGRLLLWGESGVGDEVLCAGLIAEVIAAGTSIVLETDRRFVPLFQRTFPSATVFLRKTPPEPPANAPDVTAQSSTLRLPMLLRRRWQDFRRHQGYLKADPGMVADYRARFAALGPGRKIGLAWASTNARTGGRKSTGLADWAPVLATPETQFVSLQYSRVDDEIDAMRTRGFANLWPNPNPDIRIDLDGLAAEIAALDLVITIAGINAHMAGALARPGFVLVQHTPLWFWFDRGDDSPWYPSLRMFRQEADGDWGQPIARIAAALALAQC
jgi:tetratricopeptide (TPR) repeat protein